MIWYVRDEAVKLSYIFYPYLSDGKEISYKGRVKGTIQRGIQPRSLSAHDEPSMEVSQSA